MKADIWDIDVAESRFMARSSLMLNFAEVNVARRERPVGICPQCQT